LPEQPSFEDWLICDGEEEEQQTSEDVTRAEVLAHVKAPDESPREKPPRRPRPAARYWKAVEEAQMGAQRAPLPSHSPIYTEEVYELPPSRMAAEGDVRRSYSAAYVFVTPLDGGPPGVCPPFEFEGGRWVAMVGEGLRNGLWKYSCYRLRSEAEMDALDDGERKRLSEVPMSQFVYHGRRVRYQGEVMVLTGPPAWFVPEGGL
jgi:hypothetical protein